jgi:hypothetical protein
MAKGTAHLAGYDTLTDSEVGHLLVEQHCGRFTGTSFGVQFARAALERLGLASERTLEAYEALFHRGDQAAFPVLAQAHGAS